MDIAHQMALATVMQPERLLIGKYIHLEDPLIGS